MELLHNSDIVQWQQGGSGQNDIHQRDLGDCQSSAHGEETAVLRIGWTHCRNDQLDLHD